MTELIEILNALKARHGTDAGTAAAAGISGATISRLRAYERGEAGGRKLGLVVLCGLLRATSDIALQTRLLQVSGISDALLQGHNVAVVERGE